MVPQQKSDFHWVLASSSPRRKDILAKIGIACEILPARIDELQFKTTSLVDLARILARAKALTSFTNLMSRAQESAAPEKLSAPPGLESDQASFLPKRAHPLTFYKNTLENDQLRKRPTILIGSDTIVDFNGTAVEKPTTDREAAQALERLRGKRHTVHSGLCLLIVDTPERLRQHYSNLNRSSDSKARIDPETTDDREPLASSRHAEVSTDSTDSTDSKNNAMAYRAASQSLFSNLYVQMISKDNLESKATKENRSDAPAATAKTETNLPGDLPIEIKAWLNSHQIDSLEGQPTENRSENRPDLPDHREFGPDPIALIISAVDSTEVCMRNYSDSEIQSYIETQEYRGKAGGYAIQGLGGSLVENIAGDYQTIVGFPLAKFMDLISSMELLLTES